MNTRKCHVCGKTVIPQNIETTKQDNQFLLQWFCLECGSLNIESMTKADDQ